MTKTNNSRITLAILKRDMEYVIKGVDKLNKKYDMSSGKIEQLETQQAVLKSKQSVWNVGLIGLNVVVGAIASAIGLRK